MASKLATTVSEKIFTGIMASLNFASKLLDSGLLKRERETGEAGIPPDSKSGLESNLDHDVVLKAIQNSAAEGNAQIKQAIEHAVGQINSKIDDSVATLVQKIELETHEKLLARINSVSRVLRMDSIDNCLPLVLELDELNTYALRRMNEGKLHWTASCILGKTMYIAAMDRLAVRSDSQLREELSVICSQAKSQVLDLLVPEILANGGKVSWEQIAHFLSNSGDTVSIIGFIREGGTVPPISSRPVPCGTVTEQRIRPKGNFQTGRVVRWRKSVGDIVSPGDILVGISIDGQVQTIYAELQGTLSQVIISNGQGFSSNQEVLLGLVST